jgi:hypothetical protein
MFAIIQYRTFLSSHLLLQNVRINAHTTIILAVVFHSYQTWFSKLKEKLGLRVWFKKDIILVWCAFLNRARN